jgi:hypothetical protein
MGEPAAPTPAPPPRARLPPPPAQSTALRDLRGDTDEVRARGLGALAVLPDELLVALLGELPPAALAALAATSRAARAFATHEELWKALALERAPSKWRYRGSWRETALAALGPPGAAAAAAAAPPPHPHPRLYSDLLHRGWLCATAEPDPEWLITESIDRRAGLTPAQFRDEYERLNRPVILTDVVPTWPAYRKWSRAYLAKALGDAPVFVGNAPLPFGAYCAYADAQRDELPLYLFDRDAFSRCPALAADFSPPPHFGEDLFAVLGETARPDYRWLIVGPARSGSTFHLDPNATSAWNGVVRGAKRWALYPPGAPPPGVRPSADGADVAAPVSVAEWYLSFYDVRAAGGAAPLECTLRAGELLFVPRGWWHAALNLEDDTVAVTQNYTSAANLGAVLAFLGRPRAEALVSGVRGAAARRSLRARFVAALRAERPGVMEALAEEEAAARRRAEEAGKLAALFKEAAPAAAGGAEGAEGAAAAAGGGGFSFGFSV